MANIKSMRESERTATIMKALSSALGEQRISTEYSHTF
jgi:hypothetical protein